MYSLIWKSEVIEDEIESLKEARYLQSEYNLAYNGGPGPFPSLLVVAQAGVSNPLQQGEGGRAFESIPRFPAQELHYPSKLARV